MIYVFSGVVKRRCVRLVTRTFSQYTYSLWKYICENGKTFIKLTKMKSKSRKVAHHSFLIGCKIVLSLQSQEALCGIICYREMEKMFH